MARGGRGAPGGRDLEGACGRSCGNSHRVDRAVLGAGPRLAKRRLREVVSEPGPPLHSTLVHLQRRKRRQTGESLLRGSSFLLRGLV